jgi:hypothetical protein
LSRSKPAEDGGGGRSPLAEIVAKTVIENGATGVREPSEISKIAIKRLAIVTAVPERAPPLAPSLKHHDHDHHPLCLWYALAVPMTEGDAA